MSTMSTTTFSDRRHKGVISGKFHPDQNLLEPLDVKEAKNKIFCGG